MNNNSHVSGLKLINRFEAVIISNNYTGERATLGFSSNSFVFNLVYSTRFQQPK